MAIKAKACVVSRSLSSACAPRRLRSGCGWRIAGCAPESAALLSVILADRASPRRLLYLAGRQRRETLETQLRAAGREVVTLETYEAREAAALTGEAAKALAGGELSAALHYSPRSAAIFARLALGANLVAETRALAHFVISAETAAALAPLGPLTTRFAASPDEDALLAALAAFDWAQQSQI